MQDHYWSPISWVRFFRLMYPKPEEPSPLPVQPLHNRRHTDQKQDKDPVSQNDEMRKAFEVDYSYAERDLEKITQDYNLLKFLVGQAAAEQCIFDNHWLVLDDFDTSFVLPEGFDLIDLVFLQKFQINLEEPGQKVLVSCEKSALPPEPRL